MSDLSQRQIRELPSLNLDSAPVPSCMPFALDLHLGSNVRCSERMLMYIYVSEPEKTQIPEKIRDYHPKELVINKINQDELEVIKVSIYYETLCSDSRNFILKQLLPTYGLLDNQIDLDFIPYGKAQTIVNADNSLSFLCQHGSTECIGNKIHSCIINQSKSQRILIHYIGCMIDDNTYPFEVAEKCGKRYSINYPEIEACANSNFGSELLQENGKRTDAVTPTITFIPTIQFNNTLNVPLSLVLKDFKKELCKTFKTVPKECLLN